MSAKDTPTIKTLSDEQRAKEFKRIKRNAVRRKDYKQGLEQGIKFEDYRVIYTHWADGYYIQEILQDNTPVNIIYTFEGSIDLVAFNRPIPKHLIKKANLKAKVCF